MALIIETGAGVRGANCVFNVAFMNSFLAERGRSDENGWSGLGASEKEQFIIKGMDYLKKAWDGRLRGIRKFSFADVRATATGTFTGLPSDADTITVGAETYTMKTALSGAANEVLIGADATECAFNVDAAIEATAAYAGVLFGTGTQANSGCTSVALAGVLTFTAIAPGTSGNYTSISESADNFTASAAFTGGLDGGEQPQLFPRAGIYTNAGIAVHGIPLDFKFAAAEYTIRAAAGDLDPDPTSDSFGGTVVRLREKVGPIDTDTEYLPGTVGSGRRPSYPAADRYMRQYAFSGGGVIRG